MTVEQAAEAIAKFLELTPLTREECLEALEKAEERVLAVPVAQVNE